MEFFDFSDILNAAQDPLTFSLYVLRKGWVLFVLGAIIGFGPVGYLVYIRNKYDAQRKFTMLAIDIPKNNEQSPKAVQQIFTQFSGISITQNFYEKWIAGMMTESFSLEIVSMGGYIQFLIQTPTKFRDLVEAAIYSQYPDAEIVEVEDYAQKTKGLTFPNSEYEMWGTEFLLSNKEYFPIKTYMEFEHSLSQEFKDPMSAFMENMSKIGPDEQLWLQLVVTPAPDSWKDGAQALIKKIIGEKASTNKNMLDTIIDAPVNIISSLGGLGALFGTGEKKEERAGPKNNWMSLTTGEKSAVEAIQMKTGKIGFYTKFRTIYIARKAAFSKPRGVSALIGSIKQFNIVGQNGFKISRRYTPSIDFWFKKYRNNARKNKLLRLYRYRARNLHPGYYGYVLNIEELATIWHFPIMTVRAPLLKRIDSKKGEPPGSLPIEGGFAFEVVEEGSQRAEEREAPNK